MPPRKPVSLELTMGAGFAEPDKSDAVGAPSPPKGAATIEKLTVYVPRGAAKRLKQMALDNDRRVNDYLQEGVDLVLAKYGQPALKDFEPK